MVGGAQGPALSKHWDDVAVVVIVIVAVVVVAVICGGGAFPTGPWSQPDQQGTLLVLGDPVKLSTLFCSSRAPKQRLVLDFRMPVVIVSWVLHYLPFPGNSLVP